MIPRYLISVIILISAFVIILPKFLDSGDISFVIPYINKIDQAISTEVIINDVNEEEAEKIEDGEAEIQKNILLNVPFILQAPLGNWSDPRQQDGCEEASVMMAMRWMQDEIITKQEALKELLRLVKWQTEEYNEHRDTSASSTAQRLLKEYYNHENFRVVYSITAEDIILELQAGNLIITPMDGRELGNPYFTPPGPTRHMVVIRGYDFDTAEFITNDPGTRRGEEYRYKQDIFFSAIRDYPTGYHEKINKIIKAMIVVKK